MAQQITEKETNNKTNEAIADKTHNTKKRVKGIHR